MEAGFSQTNNADEASDYLFTWVPHHWPHEKLVEFVRQFASDGHVEETWTCAAYRKIRPGDRAYLLKQGAPIGIFGRGRVLESPRRKEEGESGRGKWEVLLCFDASCGDVLCDPFEGFFIDEKQLSTVTAPKTQWQHRAAGVTLSYKAAREIDNLLTGARSIAAWTLQQGIDEAVIDVVEQMKSSRGAPQGFLMSPKARRAIEERAVELAKEHYKEKGYAVRVVGKPYDLLCEGKSGNKIYVEVKGTQGSGREVLLTPNEVAFARDHKHQMALFVISNIALCSDDPEAPTASGGDLAVYEPWDIDTCELDALGYSLTITKNA